jgi:mRNA interferase MazF
VLVVQSNIINRSRISTVVVLALTTSTRLAAAPGNVLLPARATGLPRDSVANVSQILTADRSLLTERIGSMPPGFVKRVEDGLRLVLAL